jgi:hypothetical protein
MDGEWYVFGESELKEKMSFSQPMCWRGRDSWQDGQRRVKPGVCFVQNIPTRTQVVRSRLTFLEDGDSSMVILNGQ